MSYLKQDAEDSAQAVRAFHSHHSKMTWNAGTPGIDPWLRETLVALQGTLQTMAATQVKLAEQVDRNSERLTRIERHLNGRQ